MNKFEAVAVVAVLALLAVCGSAEEVSDTVDESGAPEQTAPDGMAGMQGLPGMTAQDAGAEQLQTHMQMMMGASPESMLAMMPEHRQMAANMLAQMNREMQQMNMPGDSAWTATADSLREDLTRMPELSAQELAMFMAGHHARMTRLMEMHRSMMGRMGR
jgi:D-mannonate dehydratase